MRQDLSPAAIRRAVLGQSLQHPSVVYPAVLGALGGLGAAVVAGSPLVVGAAIAAGVVALSAFGANFFLRHDRIAGSYLESVRKQLAADLQAQIADLGKDLKEVKAEEASRQLDRFVEKMSTFQAVLAERLSPGELTFARFSAIAEAVYLAGVDNLRAIHISMRSLQSVDEGYVNGRLKVLAKEADAAHDTEVQGLREQLEHAKTLRERVRERLGQNEQAMAQLDRATAAIGEMKTHADRPSMSMEAAMQELARIAQRSADY
jgi:hypothetical protein